MGTTDADVTAVLDTAIKAYNDAIEQDAVLTTCMLNLMAEYVALRLRVTEKTARLLLEARLSVLQAQRRALDDSS